MLHRSKAEHLRRCSIKQRNTSRLGVRRVESGNLVTFNTEQSPINCAKAMSARDGGSRTRNVQMRAIALGRVSNMRKAF